MQVGDKPHIFTWESIQSNKWPTGCATLTVTSAVNVGVPIIISSWFLQMAAALANRAMGAIVGSAVADAAGIDVKSFKFCCDCAVSQRPFSIHLHNTGVNWCRAGAVLTECSPTTAQPLHWVYDLQKVQAVLAQNPSPEFHSESLNPFYRRQTGQQSCYGDQAFVLLESLSECGGRHGSHFRFTAATSYRLLQTLGR